MRSLRYPLAFLALLLSTALLGARPSLTPALIDVTDTASLQAAVGEHVVVEGVVTSAEWSRSGKVMNVTFEGVSELDFGVAMFERNRENFDEGFAGDFAGAITGERIRIRGELSEYGGRDERFAGRPEMILNSPSQVTIFVDDE
jgi:hypothetical protein